VTQNESFYQDRRELYEGRVVMFRRPDSWRRDEDRIWQARFKLQGLAGYKTVSLKTPIYDDARVKAHELYIRFQQMVRDGASLRQRSFAQAWKEWFNQMVGDGVWSDSRKKWHFNYFNRYFNAYFGSKKLDDITMDFANSYWGWRKRYWVDGPGANPAANQMKYNRRRRGLGNVTTHNAKKTPAHKTLMMEQAALNQIFDWCYSEKRFMRYAIKMKMKVLASQRKRQGEGIRPSFTDDEWEVLTWNLRSWADGDGKYANDKLNEFHRHHRKQLRFYVLFVANTGIRPGTETRFMKWGDISPIKIDMPDEKTGKKFTEDALTIRIGENSKTGERTAISLPDAIGLMKEWRSISHFPDDQHLVWYGNSKAGAEQKQITDLNKTFQAFLKTVAYKGREDGLLNDARGRRRSLYSLRHFYASTRVRAGVSYQDLCRTMGTGIPQLVKHYDDTVTVQRAAEINKTQSRRFPTMEELKKYLTPEEYDEVKKQISAVRETFQELPTDAELKEYLTPQIRKLIRRVTEKQQQLL
jgi:hypothetical protein